MNVIHSKWYGWIPTNRGKLKFDFIKLHEELLKNSNKDYLKSDSCTEGDEPPYAERIEDCMSVAFENYTLV